MATDRKPEPPRTAAAWIGFRVHCKTIGKPEWADIPPIVWPEDEPWKPQHGPRWIPVAEDHPFKGCTFCWRCLAEAQGDTAGGIPHNRTGGVICFQADRDPGTEDRVEDVGGTPQVGFADPARPALAGEAEFRQWWLTGASIVRDGADETAAVDEQPQPSPPDDTEPDRLRTAEADGAWTPSFRKGYDTGSFFYDGPTASRKRKV